MTTPAPAKRPAAVPYKRIATEEAFAPPEMLKMYERLIAKGIDDPGFTDLWGFHIKSTAGRPKFIRDCVTEIGDTRIRHMDESGIDVQVLSLTSPGVQVLDKEDAVAYLPQANDYLADAMKKYPGRFVGLAAIAPQDPQFSAREIERCVNKLGFRGVILNSHTRGEYMSDPKFWDIFAAAEALDVPIYLHPNTMPPKMVQPFQEVGLEGAVFGFGVETALHALRIITSGAFDKFPRLQMILGHMGEALPYWGYRLDYMHYATAAANRYPNLKVLPRKVTDYLRDNFHITNSGVAWEPAIRFAQEFMGEDRVLYAMDYPYQYVIDEVIALDNMDMAPAVKKKFFQTNAENLFKFKAE
ncbi:MAG TPA: amidohydrolase family protein [Ramlibacter sp.]|jgi:2,3-dihydroxybenzoate decarboxylase|nr:amidohydrolase family protein [Ramlibacter sp.]